MAVGDVKSNISTIASGSFVDVKPPSGEEWVIHNVYWSAPASGAIKLTRTDGTNAIDFDSDTSAGGRLGMTFHVTNTNWLQFNASAIASGNLTFAYDGIQTK